MKLTRILTMLIALLLLLAVPALCEGEMDWQAVLDEGTTAYKNEDYSKALELWLTVPTEYMDGRVANSIGWMHDHGEGVAEDDAKALEWYLIGHEKGNMTATANAGIMYYNAKNYSEAYQYFSQCEVDSLGKTAAYVFGLMYDDGRGVDEDDAMALKLYAHSHEKGYVKGTIELGYLYYETKEYAKALEVWLTLSENDMTGHLMYSIGWMYSSGNGVKENDREALKWYKLSADAGYDLGEAVYGNACMTGDYVALDIDTGLMYLNRAVEQGSGYAMGKLAWHYYYGVADDGGEWYLEPDYELAYKYAYDAISLENNQYPEGCRIYAELCRNGHYMQKASDDVTIGWYLGAAQRGDYYSYSQIGYIQYYYVHDYDEAAKNLELYLEKATKEEEAENAWVFHLLGRVYGDLGTKRDPDKCLLYASKGAEYGNAWCMYVLGCYYRGGWGGTADYELALLWFQRGADAGNSWCMTCMGEMYDNGWGVEQDYALARDWYQKALAAGDDGAQDRLDKLPQ